MVKKRVESDDSEYRQQNQSNEPLVKIMGMYKCKSPKGQYISGKANFDMTIKTGQKLYLFINERKQSEHHPDYNLVIRGGVIKHATERDDEIPF